MLMGAQIGNIHTLKDLGLYLKVGSPMISGAEPETMLVSVPGSDFILDLSRALDGEVHYKQRTIKMELLCKAKKEPVEHHPERPRKRPAGPVAALHL